MRISDWSSDVCSSDLATNGTGDIWISSRYRSSISILEMDVDAFGALWTTAIFFRASSVYTSCCTQRTSRFMVRGSSRSSRTMATSRSEEHTSELQSLMRISYAVFCLKKKTQTNHLQT